MTRRLPRPTVLWKMYSCARFHGESVAASIQMALLFERLTRGLSDE